MIAILLTILKIIGIILLVLLGILVLLIFCALFVPVRYKITAHRKVGEEAPFTAVIRMSWLLHIINVAFSYPEAAYLRVRAFCFTLYRSDQTPKEKPKSQKKDQSPKKDRTQKEEQAETVQSREAEETVTLKAEKESGEQAQGETESLEPEAAAPVKSADENNSKQQKTGKKKQKKRKEDTLWGFFKKLWDALKNIQYTIAKICDKIKHIVKNIQYYTEILKSELFKRTWTLCSGQVLELLKMLRPRNIKGNLVVGTGDPASTGQVLAIFGILYPFLNADVVITPDFEQPILEGDVTARGRITIFRLLKIAITVYFNKDLRRMMKMFKREAA